MTTRSIFRASFVAALLALLTGCASTVNTVPLRIQSQPLGAYVLFQVQADAAHDRSYDWVFLGNTPLDTRRTVDARDLKHADAFVIKVLKEGYIEQHKSYTGEQLVEEAQSKGAVYWNPKLVPAN